MPILFYLQSTASLVVSEYTCAILVLTPFTALFCEVAVSKMYKASTRLT